MTLDLSFPVLPTDRDFRGYGSNPPFACWPRDARLAMSVVVNIEEGAELSVAAGDEKNEFIYEAIERVDGLRDLCMESHYEYGTRRRLCFGGRLCQLLHWLPGPIAGRRRGRTPHDVRRTPSTDHWPPGPDWRTRKVSDVRGRTTRGLVCQT